ncbi:MAG: DNA polymerase III subunit epsilon [Gammaproteobacteria bacterium RIFCSPLOWO2_02_FULL_61_13]|nr:MAG: DNA polymerase III subunit epsilon [Gammaproteobacteria bacterium RIFCSPLOWO2_02_FULL_61_13]
MRQVILDTETTGLDPLQGHRIIEIGCVELRNRRRTDREFRHYLNPDRDIEAGAFNVHGISLQDLAGKPRFAEIVQELLDFVRDAEVIIHNAAFDVEFINTELKQLGPEWGRFADHCTVIDSLALARQLHPGQKNSLDALCARYHVDNSARDVHGALRDAQLLADVYLAMTGGQAALLLDGVESPPTESASRAARSSNQAGRSLRVIRPSAAELAAHQHRLADIDRLSAGRCIWLRDGDRG